MYHLNQNHQCLVVLEVPSILGVLGHRGDQAGHLDLGHLEVLQPIREESEVELETRT